MRVGRWRWLVVVVIAVGAVVIVMARRDDRGDDRPEAVHTEVVLCAEVSAVPAEASSGDRQRGPVPDVVQDPRCDDLAVAPTPGAVVLPRHAEIDAAVGNVVLAGELRFDAQQRCFYVVADDEPIGVVWPAAFTGDADPPRISDERPSTVVAVGDRFEVRGRYVSATADCGPVESGSTAFMASADVVVRGG